jgi:hypothetical protein
MLMSVLGRWVSLVAEQIHGYVFLYCESGIEYSR